MRSVPRSYFWSVINTKEILLGPALKRQLQQHFKLNQIKIKSV